MARMAIRGQARTNAVGGQREDALAEFQPFKDRVPNRVRSTFVGVIQCHVNHQVYNRQTKEQQANFCPSNCHVNERQTSSDFHRSLE